MKTLVATDKFVQELLSLVKTVTFDTYKPIKFKGIPFLFFWSSEQDDRGYGFYAYSTLTGGIDVYVFEGAPQDQMERVLFHEIWEASLRQHCDEEEAHRLTLELEEQLFGQREQLAA